MSREYENAPRLSQDWMDNDLDWLNIRQPGAQENAAAEEPTARTPVAGTERKAPDPTRTAGLYRELAHDDDEERFFRELIWEDEEPDTAPAPAEREYERYRDEQTKKKGEGGKGGSALLTVIIVLLVMGVLFAGYQLGSILLNYHRDRSAYSELAAAAISSAGGTVRPQLQTGAGGEETGDAPRDETAPSEVPLSVDWAYLRSQNSEIRGWLYCPDTIINYPVVQRSDHDFYLNHGFDGEPNTSGTLFLDMNSVAGIIQSNLIIYGHNMKDNSMFGTLQGYVDRSYYEEHPVLYYLTPDGSYRIEIICCRIVESTLDNFPTYFSDMTAYQDYIDRITSGAFWVNADLIDPDRQLVTLSTCSYSGGYDDPRFLLHGVMIPIE